MARDRRSMVLGKRARKIVRWPSAFIYWRDARQYRCTYDSETHNDLASPPSFTLDLHLRLYPKLSFYFSFPRLLSCLSLTMALNFIQFYQLSIKASLPRERVSQALNFNVPTVLENGKPFKAPGPSSGWRGRLCGDNSIEFIDMTDSPLREQFSPFRESASDHKGIEADVGGRLSVIFSQTVINDWRCDQAGLRWGHHFGFERKWKKGRVQQLRVSLKWRLTVYRVYRWADDIE